MIALVFNEFLDGSERFIVEVQSISRPRAAVLSDAALQPSDL